MTDVKEIIKSNRPELSDGSVRTYSSILNNMAKAIGIKPSKKEYLDSQDKIFDYIKPFGAKKRKTILASLVVLFDDKTDNEDAKNLLDKFREMMLKDISSSNTEDDKQQLTDKQKENWVPWSRIQKVYDDLKEEVKPLWKKDEPLKKSAFMRLQDFVMLSCLLLISPRRSLDWTDFKLRNIDKDKDNHLDGNKLVFVSYKTKKWYGKQTVDIAKNPLKKILNDWAKINKSDYLFLDTTLKQPLNPTKMTIRLYNLFDKKISINMLRHIYISEKVLPNVPKLTEMLKTAEEMGHNVLQQLKYKKNTNSKDDSKTDESEKTS
jgi:hypothetical protein